MTDRPLHLPTGAFGPAHRFLGEAGLADARRALQHDAAARASTVETADVLELGRPPGERPRCDDHTPATR